MKYVEDIEIINTVFSEQEEEEEKVYSKKTKEKAEKLYTVMTPLVEEIISISQKYIKDPDVINNIKERLDQEETMVSELSKHILSFISAD